MIELENKGQVPKGSRKQFELSIVMPCLNESETIGKCIQKAKSFVEKRGITAEIVIGDNGSSDGSQEIAIKHGAKVVHVPKRGYGAALQGAISASSGNYIVMGDSDDSYDFAELDGFLEQLRNGYELVMGNRFRGGILKGAMPWKNRWIGNPALSFLGRMFFKIPCGDFHCGMRAFSRHAFDRMSLKTPGMEFASEMVVRAGILGLKMTEVPIFLHPDGRNRKPHLRPWRDGWRHLRYMLLLSPNYLFLYPGILSLILGVGIVAAAVAQALSLFSLFEVGFGPNTMICGATMVYVGFQMITFWIFSRLYAWKAGLLPQSVSVGKFTMRFKLEHGIIASSLLVLSSFVSAFVVFSEWAERGFGPFDSPVHTVFAVYSGFAFALSVMLAHSSFFLIILRQD